MQLNVTMTGKEQLLKNMQSLGTKGPRLMGKALFNEGHRIMTEAKKITPVDFGKLVGSGNVMKESVTPTGASVTLGFGGAAAPYAIFVHENLRARHTAPTTAKYLETPLMAAASGMAERLNADLQKELKP
jgi:hypothetical protein